MTGPGPSTGHWSGCPSSSARRGERGTGLRGARRRRGYARLLNDGGEFVAEVPLGEDGGFRFFAAPGTWTVRVLAPGGVSTDQTVTAGYGRPTALEVSV